VEKPFLRVQTRDKSVLVRDTHEFELGARVLGKGSCFACF